MITVTGRYLYTSQIALVALFVIASPACNNFMDPFGPVFGSRIDPWHAWSEVSGGTHSSDLPVSQSALSATKSWTQTEEQNGFVDELGRKVCIWNLKDKKTHNSWTGFGVFNSRTALDERDQKSALTRRVKNVDPNWSLGDQSPNACRAAIAGSLSVKDYVEDAARELRQGWKANGAILSLEQMF